MKECKRLKSYNFYDLCHFLRSFCFLPNRIRALQILPTMDPSLGRVDYSSFSDQTPMEMLFEGFDEDSQKKYRDKDGMYINVCKWDCVECDDNGRVVKLTVRRYVSGSLNIRYIPPKVKLFDISSKQLKGTIDYAEFPESIEILYLRHISWESAMNTATQPKKSAHFRQP